MRMALHVPMRMPVLTQSFKIHDYSDDYHQYSNQVPSAARFAMVCVDAHTLVCRAWQRIRKRKDSNRSDSRQLRVALWLGPCVRTGVDNGATAPNNDHGHYDKPQRRATIPSR